MKHKNIAIIGAGEIGKAIEFLALGVGHNVQKWDADPSKVPGQKPLETIISKSQIVFLCVPSWVLRSALNSIKPFLKPRAVVIFLSKGMEQDGKTVPELAEEIIQNQPFVLLSGPMLAEEIMKGLGGVAVAASQSARARRIASELFDGSALRVETSSDVKGIAFAAVLKNIYSVGLGIAEGLGWGANKRGWLAQLAVLEMMQILPLLGGKERSVFSPAGVADFVATGFSQYSSNRQVGDELVVTGISSKKSEGLVSLSPLSARLGARAADAPFLSLLRRALEQHENITSAFNAFFSQKS